jgi:hypothetical protein
MRHLISLSRGSLGEGGCSMRITEDVRKYAVEHGLPYAEAIESGMQKRGKNSWRKARRFTRRADVVAASLC